MYVDIQCVHQHYLSLQCLCLSDNNFFDMLYILPSYTGMNILPHHQKNGLCDLHSR